MRTLPYVHTRAQFVWVVDDRAIFSYGPTYNPEFHSLTKTAWEALGKPKLIQIAISAL